MPTARQLTDQHRRQQLQLRAVTLRELLRLFPTWRLEDPASFDAFATATVPLVQLRHRDSARTAAAYYTAFRTAQRVPGKATPVLAKFNPKQAVASLYVTGQVQTAKALAGGVPVETARAHALVRVSGAVSRLVLNGGRETTIESLKADPRGRGWQRVTSGNACDFCEMLAGRGAVYSQDSADFASHDHCACGAEPVFG